MSAFVAAEASEPAGEDATGEKLAKLALDEHWQAVAGGPRRFGGVSYTSVLTLTDEVAFGDLRRRAARFLDRPNRFFERGTRGRRESLETIRFAAERLHPPEHPAKGCDRRTDLLSERAKLRASCGSEGAPRS